MQQQQQEQSQQQQQTNQIQIHKPNTTLYIKNIDWKIKKGILRRSLYNLVTRHGKCIEIITLRKNNLRGQAFVIMESVTAATAVLQNEQGINFFGKDLVIQFATTPTYNRTTLQQRGDETIVVPLNKRARQQLAKTNQLQQQQQQEGTEDDNNEQPEQVQETPETI